MKHHNLSASKKVNSKRDLPVTLGLVAVLMFFFVSGAISYSNTKTLKENSQKIARTHDIIVGLEDLLSITKDAETGQRGFVLTGDEQYLAPYIAAVSRINDRISQIERLVADNPVQKERLPQIKAHIHAKLDELNETINLRRAKGFEAARNLIITDRGKNEMDTIRARINEMQSTEREYRARNIEQMEDSYIIAVVSGVLAGLFGVLLSVVVAYLIRRAAAIRYRQEWLQEGQVGLSKNMIGDLRMEQLGDNILKFLAEYFDAHAGAFFVKDGDSYRRVSTYGVPSKDKIANRFILNDGLLGRAAKDGKTFIVNDVPDNYLTISSALGEGNPRHLIISPANIDGMVNAVLELGFIHPINELSVQMLEQVASSIGIAVRSANYRANLQNLLEETQRQSEELQTQSEELRVSNEELEEQSRALKESQARLEQQQVELEQTNSQLEEQTQLLEGQKDDLSKAKVAVQQKADELERASQYKSDFLANMSHELRTPLNSSLIMAKLLADNVAGNLTAEQVKFAQTIQSSGNDLLLLINDILDLSKIEAGHMEVRAEPMLLSSLKELALSFETVAKQKNLTFSLSIAKNSPEEMVTDRLRLEQILKNLLSNAIKFTEKGNVKLHISKEGKSIAFAVTDTGIGITEEQQQSVFEAFRQADGTISRKYGGTGLGLSISRELARLLSGRIELKSAASKGSTFTLLLPETYDETLVAERATTALQTESVATPSEIVEQRNKQNKKETIKRVSRVKDDREKLTGNSRVILIIEDDESFARILYDMAHEVNFECLIATTAEEALAVAKQYIPSAVILDVGLPDNSGLTVLDRLKRDARTRHIPVHVVSAGDYAQTALSLGAVGYMFKPVKREELANTLKQLETRLAQRLRKVLIVEDDQVQQDSMRKLLGSHDVKTVGVGTAAECLKELKKQTFDCMVLDLSLPDATGYSLLETLSREDTYSFPPVIVYTGRELSDDEEQKLRRYSKSIIIKGAKSPERLLDELTLFLHQVVSDLPLEQQKMLEKAKNRDAILENRRILVVEDDVANVYALTSILEPRGAIVQIARNGREAVEALDNSKDKQDKKIDLVLMDVMMPEVDGLTATRQIRKKSEWKKLPIIMLTAKAMRDDQDRCLDAGANDYMAKPIDVDKLLSLIRVWMPR